jgi:hypothetical protein
MKHTCKACLPSFWQVTMIFILANDDQFVQANNDHKQASFCLANVFEALIENEKSGD